MMDIDEILRAMATYVGETVTALGASIYPPPDQIEHAQIPALVLFWGGDFDTTIQYNAGAEQLWLAAVKGQILVPAINDTPSQLATVSKLVLPIVDAFAPRGDGMSAVSRLPALSGHVDRIQVDRVRTSLMVDYAGSNYYCAEVYFSIKFRRLPTLPQEAP